MHCIHYVYGHSGVDSKDKLYTFCMLFDSKDKLYTFCTLYLRVLFTFHIYPYRISYQVAASQITWARKGHTLFFNLCNFYL